MSSLAQIKAPIEQELAVFQKKFRSSLQSKSPLLDKIMGYIVKRKGKQMRPMFTLLSAKIANESVQETTYIGASMVELLHTATLVHDDVVDDSLYRRGFFSINALWKNKIAVLVGDYLLSKGLLTALNNNQFHLLKELSTAVEEMSEGELIQIEKARRLDIDEAVYFDIIQKKTASLIATSCAVGAMSVTEDETVITKLRKIGEYAGISFQIRDDLFDYGTDDVGKPVGNDLKEKKMTLPLIHALDNASWLEKKKIINTIKRNSSKPEKLQYVIQFVKEKGGLEYATKTMYDYRKKAFDLLDELPQNDSTKAMRDLITYVTERKK